MERVNTEKSCDISTGQCFMMEQRSDFITPGRRCYEKMLEPVCATIDCKFQAREQEECATTSRPINVCNFCVIFAYCIQNKYFCYICHF